MSDSDKLKIVFIWHHHQPYYKTDGSFLMPWVRMHGIKDYWDMVRILDDYPGIKQTFNFAPSLLEQIHDYTQNGAKDSAYHLSRKDPASFSDQERLEAMRTFFFANEERMIRRYPGYLELLNKRGQVKSEKDLNSAAARFAPQDFRDLQVWWNLSWVGEYSRFDPPFKNYLEKGKNFSESEKARLLKAQIEILKRIIPHHKRAMKRGQIEISTSPFYHPILPLLCDTNIAKSSDPNTSLPATRFEYPKDAEYQIQSAIKYSSRDFGRTPQGMWPSEGSVSDDALKLIVKNGLKWVATDEAILHKTLAAMGIPTTSEFAEKYFPYQFMSGNRSTKIFFRDHSLSDLIGFVYSRWSPDDAAKDFVARLLKIRETILARYGNLEHAAVSIILDGENAWEFYQSDGKDFLRTLYYLLEREDRLETALPSEVPVKPGYILKHVEPGSWINGNFRIWIGHPEDNSAWDSLFAAREQLKKIGKNLSKKKRDLAFREILIAEGSDWCWWFGDENKSVETPKFDELFRYHLKRVYTILGKKPPDSLDQPIKRKVEKGICEQPAKKISPDVDRPFDPRVWSHAGSIAHDGDGGSMHKSGVALDRVMIGNDSRNIYLRIEPSQALTDERVVVNMSLPGRISMEIGNDFELKCDSTSKGLTQITCNRDRDIFLAVSRGESKSAEVELSVHLLSGNMEIDSLPRQGMARFKLVQ